MTAKPILRALAPDLWEAEQHLTRGLHVRRRMTVVRLAGGGLWLHSPIAIEGELAAALAALGPVEHIVAPNRFHHIYAGVTRRRYPAATLWGAPGLAEKRRDITFDRVLDEAALPWQGTLDAIHMRGAPFFSEFVFFHRPSLSLICTDALFNIQHEPSGLTRLLYRALGVFNKFGQSRVWRWNTRDPDAMAAAIERVLAWEPRRVVPAHGDVLTDLEPGRLRAALGRAPALT